MSARLHLYADAPPRAPRSPLGWREVEQRHFLALPGESEEMFGRVPSVSSSFSWERIALIELRRRFVAAYQRARALYLAKRSDVVFPFGSWQLVSGLRCRRAGGPFVTVQRR